MIDVHYKLSQEAPWGKSTACSRVRRVAFGRAPSREERLRYNGLDSLRYAFGLARAFETHMTHNGPTPGSLPRTARGRFSRFVAQRPAAAELAVFGEARFSP